MSSKNLGKIARETGRILILSTLLGATCAPGPTFTGILKDMEKGKTGQGLFGQDFTVTLDIENYSGTHNIITQSFSNSSEANIYERKYQAKIGRTITVYYSCWGEGIIDSIR